MGRRRWMGQRALALTILVTLVTTTLPTAVVSAAFTPSTNA